MLASLIMPLRVDLMKPRIEARQIAFDCHAKSANLCVTGKTSAEQILAERMTPAPVFPSKMQFRAINFFGFSQIPYASQKL